MSKTADGQDASQYLLHEAWWEMFLLEFRARKKKWAFPKDCFLISGYKIYVAWSISFIFPVYPETQRKTDDSIYPSV